MNKVLSLLLLIVILLCVVSPTVNALGDEATDCANALNALGLMDGTGSNPDGTPIYALDRKPNRMQAVTMLVRLLGKEQEAKSQEWEIPFTDVQEWAKPYVGYAYANKLTDGVSETRFGGDNLTSAAQYLTFVLRALGYSSDTDFKWYAAWEFTDALGITDERYNADTTDFYRADVAIISYRTLFAGQKGSDKPLYVKLYEERAITTDLMPSVLPGHPENTTTRADDGNGNSILNMYPADGMIGATPRFGYISIEFNGNISRADSSRIVLINSDSGIRYSSVYAKPGTTAKQVLIVMPSNNVQLDSNTNYYLYIPSDVIQMENGTTFGNPIYLQFKTGIIE